MKIAVFKHAPAASAFCLHPLCKPLRKLASGHTLHLYLNSEAARFPLVADLDLAAAKRLMPGDVRPYRSMLASEVKAQIASERYDVVVPDGRTGILPGPLVVLPRWGMLYFHWGPLPRMRGMHTVEWCLLRGERPWATIFFYDSGIDTGDIVATAQLPHMPRSTGQAYRAVRRLSWRLISGFCADPNGSTANRRRQRLEEGTTYYQTCKPLRRLVDWRLAGGRGPNDGSADLARTLLRLPPASAVDARAGSLAPVLTALKAPVQETRGAPFDQLVSALHFFHARKHAPSGLEPLLLGEMHRSLERPLPWEARLRLFNELVFLVERPDRGQGILHCPRVQAFLAETAEAEWRRGLPLTPSV